MGLLDQIKMLINNPVSYGNVQNKSYEELPTQGGGLFSGWGLGRSSLPIYDYQPKHRGQQHNAAPSSQPDLASLLAAQQREEAIPQQMGPAPQQPTQIPPQLLQKLAQGSPSISRQIQRPQPQQVMPEEGVYEGQNRNITDDTRARAMAWLAAQQENK
jgi:hypothetical protein